MEFQIYIRKKMAKIICKDTVIQMNETNYTQFVKNVGYYNINNR